MLNGVRKVMASLRFRLYLLWMSVKMVRVNLNFSGEPGRRVMWLDPLWRVRSLFTSSYQKDSTPTLTTPLAYLSSSSFPIEFSSRFFFKFGSDLPSTWILWVLSEEFMKFCPNFQWRETRRLLRLDLSGSEFVHHFLTFPPTKTTRHPPEPRLYACHPPPFRYFPLILGKKKN